ncbi:MAG TPA: Rieske 2Fe-2S domain-containing protein [Candidatus Limnocylindrales bacterium]|nr:Rieske 2Fe-2S domain-containing protein [Candidatus Limnocylindrales bacterium]
MTEAENNLLTKTGPGTPCGELMRRYWQPAALSEEIPIGAPPLPVKLFGEELVLFRNEERKLGLIDLHCAHRGADLSYGRLEDGGLRCIYHGWLYGVNGKIIDMPGEVDGGKSFRESICHKAYPIEERAGVIFAYMGPGNPPLFPAFGFFSVPDSHVHATKLFHDCNYLQANEGNIDLLHVSFLHFSDQDRQPPVVPPTAETLSGRGNAPGAETTAADLTDCGLRVCKLRQISPTENYIRVLEFIMPNSCAAPARQEGGMGYLVNWHVPIDDVSHWKYMFLFNWNHPLDRDVVLRDRFTFETTPDYKSKLNKSNRYNQNQALMKSQSYSGTGNNFQLHDLLITECAGTVQDRTREHLVASDAPLVASRKVMLKAILDVQQGLEPPRMKMKPTSNRLRNVVSLYGTISSSTDWKSYCREKE